jgi:hypothetical protein
MNRRTWVFENRVLKRMFGPKRDKVIRSSIKLHNEEAAPQLIVFTKRFSVQTEENETGSACGVGRCGQNIGRTT